MKIEGVPFYYMPPEDATKYAEQDDRGIGEIIVCETCELCGAPAPRFDSTQGWKMKTQRESCRKVHRPSPRLQDKTMLPVWMLEQDGKL